MTVTPELRYRRHFELGLESVVRRGAIAHLVAHAHAQYQLTLYLKGRQRFDLRGQSILGHPTEAVIIQAGEPHASRPAGDALSSLRGFYMDAEVIAEAAKSIWRGNATVAFRDPLLRDAATIARLHAAHRALDEGGLEADVEVCEALRRLVRRHAAPTGPARPPTSAERRIARVRDLIEDRVAENVRLDDLAAVAGLSRFHLIRLFRRRYGVTPFAYQRNARVERARQVLKGGGSIADAVAAGGFADQSHLGRIFLSVMGATPGQYRDSTVVAGPRAH